MSDAEDAQPHPALFTPEQMQQIRAMFKEMLQPVLNAKQDPKAKTQLNSTPPADTQEPPADSPPPPSNPTTPPLTTQNSQSAVSSSSAAQGSSGATQGSSGESQGSKKTRTTYKIDRNAGEQSIRRYRKRPPPYDPKKDPRMICHTAAHKVCSAIVRIFGHSGDW